MASSLIQEHHYPPAVIDAFFLDARDYHGIVFNYKALVEQHKQLNAKSKTKA